MNPAVGLEDGPVGAKTVIALVIGYIVVRAGAVIDDPSLTRRDHRPCANVEELIAELRRSPAPRAQRFGIFVARRFEPGDRTRSTATALARSDPSDLTFSNSNQIEVDLQNAAPIQAMADGTADESVARGRSVLHYSSKRLPGL